MGRKSRAKKASGNGHQPQPAAGQNTVFMPTGVYAISATIKTLGVPVRGAGAKLTFINLLAAFEGPVVSGINPKAKQIPCPDCGRVLITDGAEADLRQLSVTCPSCQRPMPFA